MAATMSARSKPGAWALDAEENEADLLQQHKECTSVAGGETAEFPSLAAAATTKTKKKKGQTLSLQEFSAYGAAKPAPAQPKGLTPDELLVLPTGPRQRSAEELDRNKLGGGFRSYGGGPKDEQPRRQGSFNRDSNREFAPSRADETDDWGAGKKFSVNNGSERRDRGERGCFFSNSQSRADEADNWATKKSSVPSEPRKFEKRGGFGLESTNGGADLDNWAKSKVEDGRKIGGAFDSCGRRGSSESDGVDSDSWGRKREEGIGGSRPRLNLTPRTLPVGEGQKSETDSVVKPKGSSPFGEARPREDVLKEKGQDWKEIEEKLESVKIKDVYAESTDGTVVEKRSFWSGTEKSQQEDKSERSWRRPELVDSHPQSTGKSEDAEEGNSQM